MSTTAESNVVEVTIYWPSGGSSVWRTGHPILDVDGVAPLSASELGAVTGLLCGAGVFAPLDDDRRHFLSMVSAEQLAVNLLEVLPGMDRMARGDAGGAV